MSPEQHRYASSLGQEPNVTLWFSLYTSYLWRPVMDLSSLRFAVLKVDITQGNDSTRQARPAHTRTPITYIVCSERNSSRMELTAGLEL
jgi:hypothetical protein